MRRPVKPFVTEYRGAGRRGKESAPSLTVPLHSAQSGNDMRAERARPAQKDDTSYEAALRAADALFAPQRPQARPASMPGNGSDIDDTTAALVSSAPPADAEAGRPEPASGSGRILRAIEEPVANPVPPLGAERTSKPRGRKPGSKNKSKIELAFAGASLPAALSGTAEASAPFRTDVEPEDVPVAPHRAALLTTACLPSRMRSERFSWIRTRLRPGEKWKRRLPKIAW